MSLKSLMSGVLIVAVLGVLALVVAPPTQARHRSSEPSEPTCTCKASLSLARPGLQWQSGVLTFIPRVDISIRGRGDSDAPPLDVSIDYSGVATYSSDDVSVPPDTSFAGNRSVVSGWPCDGRYRFKGLDLASVSLAGLTPDLVGEDQELTGNVTLDAAVVGCGFEEEHRQLRFRVLEFGNLKVGSWRSV